MLGRERRRILIADDHAVARGGLSADLERSGFAVCAEAADADAAVAAALRERPDVCLLDVRMPGDGIAAAQTIVRELPDTRVLMLSVSHDPDDVAASFGAGASGYLYKDAGADELAEAIDGVLAGGTVFPGRP